ncbi:hypothetical protein [Nocardia paucivorans]|uniref:hypothetical protein n=1 Tax=Nocardia paucivorans TaxID=114259 RepID=UPI0012F76A2F|nr:hypothetical protein [Nocardia paucivorans]
MVSDDPHEWWKSTSEGQGRESSSGQWQQAQGAPPTVHWDATAGRVPQPGMPGQPVPGQTGPYGPTPAGPYEIPPLGATGGWGGPPARNSNGPLIAVLVVVVVLALAGVVGLVVLRGSDSEENTTATGTTTATASTTRSTSRTTSAAPTSALSGDEPQLRTVPSVVVLGPIWGDGEDTYTMAFKGWPFAFRTARSWGCLKGSIDAIPDAQAWRCVDESNRNAGQRVDIILRKCPTTCDADTQRRYNADWLKENADRATRFDDRTVYVVEQSNERGRYSVDLSRYFADPSGGELVWQVGVYAESPPATKEVVLKAVNDIVTQTQ